MERSLVTINALDFLTAPYIMIFLCANGLRGPFEGPVPKNRDFFSPRNGYERSECHFGAKKVDGPSNLFARRKIIMYGALRKASAYIVLCT